MGFHGVITHASHGGGDWVEECLRGCKVWGEEYRWIREPGMGLREFEEPYRKALKSTGDISKGPLKRRGK